MAEITLRKDATCFNPYEGLEVIATCDRAVPVHCHSVECFNPYEGLEVIATL